MNLDFWCYGNHHIHNTQNYENTTMYAINEMQLKQIQLTEEKKDSIFKTLDWSTFSFVEAPQILSNTLANAERPAQEEMENPRRQDGFVVNLDDIFDNNTQDHDNEENEQPQPLHFGEGLAAHLDRLRVDLALRREMNRNLEPVRIDENVEERVHNEIDTLINDELF